MIGFTWIAGLLFALTAVVPLLLHLLRRTRWIAVPWPAMRLLQDLATRRGSRLAVEDLLLLAVRILLICAIALTAARPTWTQPPADTPRRGPIAGVLLLDDGLTAAARVANGDQRFDRQRELGLEWLSTLAPGDEVSQLSGSTAGEPAADPLYDLAAAARHLRAVAPGTGTPDLPRLLSAGLARLERHRNPTAELALVLSGTQAGTALDDDARWAVVSERLNRGRWPSWRAPRILLLTPAEAATGDWAVSTISCDQPLLLPQLPLQIRIGLKRTGILPPTSGMSVRLALDGRTIAEQAVVEPPVTTATHSTVTVTFQHTFSSSGSHLLEARLIGARDQLPDDDRRALAVEVANQVPVLLLEATPGELALVAAALDPSEGAEPEAPFAPRRMPAATLQTSDLVGIRVCILGDVGVLPSEVTARLESFLAAGGGVLIGCGPATDPLLSARQWFRGGDGLLAAAIADVPPLTALRQPRPAPGEPPALAGFAADSPAWNAATIRTSLAVQPGSWNRIIDLTDGSPLAVQHDRGLGQTILWLTTLDDRWHDLPWRSLWVPMMRGLVGSLASNVLPPRNLVPGEQLVWPCQGDPLPGRVALSGPDGALLPLRAGGWEGSPALFAGPLTALGGYRIRPLDPAAGVPTSFAVAPPADALDVLPLAVDRLRTRLVGYGCSVSTATTPEGVQALAPRTEDRTRIELTWWCACAAVLLVLAELALARRLTAVESR